MAAKTMSAGRLRYLVTVRKRTDVPNAAWGLDETADSGIDRWAAVEAVGAMVFLAARQSGTETTHRITFRAEAGTLPADFTREHVIDLEGTRYAVVRAFDLNSDARWTCVECTCTGAAT